MSVIWMGAYIKKCLLNHQHYEERDAISIYRVLLPNYAKAPRLFDWAVKPVFRVQLYCYKREKHDTVLVI